jgi:hypothetical protein
VRGGTLGEWWGMMMSEQNPYACSDGGCVLRVPGTPVGMSTNAGCRCIPLRMTPDERVRLRRGIEWLAERAARNSVVVAQRIDVINM